ncbi:MAG: radical SAM protein [Acidobacteria bacterium]|nr:MAG: radical SAM protein [Acidobacteriota bacterium]
MLSIEITRECPLHCPGCYAYGDSHLGGETTLRQLSDFRGQQLVEGVLDLVRKHRPLQVSLVGGEPLVRHKELSQIIPALSEMGVYTMVVTSAVIPIPQAWMEIPRLLVAVSVDGLPEHHDVRREPATYERILKNIAGHRITIHCTITSQMLGRPTYLQEFLDFWTPRPEIAAVWFSLFTPQKDARDPEILNPEQRVFVVRELRYPKLLINEGIAKALVRPPQSPQECLFSKMSVNYSADLQTRVEPCVFGGTPDCSHCGCAISSGLHWLKSIPVAGPLTIAHFVRGSIAIGSLVNRWQEQAPRPSRWHGDYQQAKQDSALVQISGGD